MMIKETEIIHSMYYKMIVNQMVDTFISEEPAASKKYSFMSGDLIDDGPDQILEFKIESYGEIEPLDFHELIIPVMSKRFVNALNEIGVDNIQTFPAVLVHEETGLKWSEYFAVNIVGKLACANLDKTTYGTIGAGVIDIENLILDYEKTKSAILFRLAEDPTIIIINEKIFNKLDSFSEPSFRGASFKYIKDTSEVE